MDPNNNQPTGANPIAQPTPQPASEPMSVPTAVLPVEPTPTPAASTPPETPKGKSSKIIILIAILLLLAVGIAAYVLFAKNQLNKNQNASTDNSLVMPTPTTVPTLAPEEDLEVASPEADLLEIEADVKGL